MTRKNSISDYPTLENCFFGSVKLTKNPVLISINILTGFDRRDDFSFGDGFGHANNKIKNILVLGKGFTQRLDNTTIYAEKMYPINFTKTNKKFCLNLYYNGSNSYLFVNDTEIY